MEDSDTPAPIVGFARDGAVAILRIDNPPVNALSAAVRTRDRDAALRHDGVARLAERHAALAASDPEEVAGLAAIEAMAIGLEHGVDAGLAAERAAFVALRDSPRAATKREAFFATRRRPPS
jgi:hypothetical protein